MKIKEVMIADLTSVSEDTTIKEVLKILSRQRLVGLPVVDNEQNVIGIITESDITKACLPDYYKELQNPSFLPDFNQFSKQAKKIAHLPVKDFMINTVHTIEEDTSRTEAANLLFRKHIRILPVVRAGKLVGILTPSSLGKHAMDEKERNN
ncbi:MAG: CBS domain-containing protein [Candidatus Caldatribacteriota bacterium]|nr:CBS domain-containing protein [Candidatus Caldatribacteriota bacterium]